VELACRCWQRQWWAGAGAAWQQQRQGHCCCCCWQPCPGPAPAAAPAATSSKGVQPRPAPAAATLIMHGVLIASYFLLKFITGTAAVRAGPAAASSAVPWAPLQAPGAALAVVLPRSAAPQFSVLHVVIVRLVSGPGITAIACQVMSVRC